MGRGVEHILGNLENVSLNPAGYCAFLSSLPFLSETYLSTGPCLQPQAGIEPRSTRFNHLTMAPQAAVYSRYYLILLNEVSVHLGCKVENDAVRIFKEFIHLRIAG